jgi:hypothetical protein
VSYFIQKAWNKVTSATITNCFKKAGFRFNNHHSPQEFNDNEFEEDDFPLVVIAEINRAMGQISYVDFDEFVNFDLYVNDEKVEIDVSIESVEVAAEDEEEAVTTENIEERIKTNRDAIETMQKLKAFCAN